MQLSPTTHPYSTVDQMQSSSRKTVRCQGKTEQVLETFRVRGRTYFAIEKLGGRGAFRVVDPHAGPGGDYRILYRLPKQEVTRQKFETLKRIGGSNRNRNFPAVVDFANHGADTFVVIEWVDGSNLGSYLDAVRSNKTPRPSVSEVVRLVRGLTHGVSHYHRRSNVIHGDISPANILLTHNSKQLLLVDFGSAWPIESTSSKDAGDGVTQPYAAPERLAKHAAEDFRSDMFSLSVVAYELLTLEIPFGRLGGRAGLPKFVAKGKQTYRKPSELIDKSRPIPKQSLRLLDACIEQGLALESAERFPTSQAWLSAWDELHMAMKKGTRLSPLEGLVVRGIESFVDLFSGKKKH